MSFQKRMTSTIQFWMNIMLNNMLPKKDDQYNPILDGYYAKRYSSKMDDQYNPILDGYYAE